jgi:phage tail sheath gpL-like
MSLKFIKMFQLPNGNITGNPILDSVQHPNSLGFNEHPDYLIKKYGDQFNLVLLRDSITPGTIIRKTVSQVSFETALSANVAAGLNLLPVGDAAGFTPGVTQVTIGSDPTVYSVVSTVAQAITISPSLVNPILSGQNVIGTYPTLTYTGRLTQNAARGTNILTIDNNGILAPGVTLQFASDTVGTVYTILTGPTSGSVAVTPPLKQSYSTSSLLTSQSLSTSGAQLSDDIKAGQTIWPISNPGVFINGDRVVIGSDAVVYTVMSKSLTTITVDVGAADNYVGPTGPFIVRDYYLYTPSGVPVRQSPLNLNIDKDIVSVAFDASSKLQYFLMSYINKVGARKYYIIRGDFTSQVFDFSTRSLDLDNLVGYPRDIAIYQNGVFILTDKNIVHMYSLKGTHRQKIEFNNFKFSLRSLDYFADFVSSYTHLGELYSNIAPGSGATVVDATIASTQGSDFPSGPIDTTYTNTSAIGASLYPLSFTPTDQKFKGWFKVPEFATLDLFSDEPYNDGGNAIGVFASRKYVIPLLPGFTGSDGEPPKPPIEFPFPIWHQAPRGIILEGPLANATYDPWHILATPDTTPPPAGTTTPPVTPPVPKEYTITDPAKRSFVHEFSLREYCVADGLLEPLDNFYTNTLGVFAAVENGERVGLRLTASDPGSDPDAASPTGDPTSDIETVLTLSGTTTSLSGTPRVLFQGPTRSSSFSSTLKGGGGSRSATGFIPLTTLANTLEILGTPSTGSFTIDGPLTLGDTITLLVGSISYVDSVVLNDTPSTIATRLAAKINNSPLIKVATAVGNVIELTARTLGTSTVTLDKMLSYTSPMTVRATPTLSGGTNSANAICSIQISGVADPTGTTPAVSASATLTLLQAVTPDLGGDVVIVNVGTHSYQTVTVADDTPAAIVGRLIEVINTDSQLLEITATTTATPGQLKLVSNIPGELGNQNVAVSIVDIPAYATPVAAHGTFTFAGSVHSPQDASPTGLFPPGASYVGLIFDIFVNGVQYTATVSTADVAAGTYDILAGTLAAAITAGSITCTATAVGSIITVKARTPGTTGNAILLSASTPPALNVQVLVSDSHLDGGADSVQVYGNSSFDRTTISGGDSADQIVVTINGVIYSAVADVVGSDAAAMAGKLESVINLDPSCPVEASVVPVGGGSAVNLILTAEVPGLAGNSIAIKTRTESIGMQVNADDAFSGGTDAAHASGVIVLGGSFDPTATIQVNIVGTTTNSYSIQVSPLATSLGDVANQLGAAFVVDPTVTVHVIDNSINLTAIHAGTTSNSVGVVSSVTGVATTTVLKSGSILSGGVDTIPAGTIEGDLVTVTVGGATFSYTAEANDTPETIASSLATLINNAATTRVPNARYADRNKFLSSTVTETYINKDLFMSFINDLKSSYVDAINLGPYGAGTLLDPPLFDGTLYPINKTFARWLLLYDNAGYVFVWDLILNKIIRSTRTGMHYHSNRTACNLGVERRPDIGQDEGVNRDELKAQLLPHFGAGAIDAVITSMGDNGIAELNITSTLMINYKTWDDFLDSLLNAAVVITFDGSNSKFGARVGSGIPLNWEVKRSLEGVKTAGIDLDKSSFLSLHDYGTLATAGSPATPGNPAVAGSPGNSLVIMEQDNFSPVISSNPNGIALVSHELRNENPQFTFTIKLWGNIGEPIIRQRVYVQMGIYNSTTVDPQVAAWNPDPIFIFSDDRGLATGTFPMPDIPIEGHIVLQFSVQAIAQPDKEEMYIYDVNPTFVTATAPDNKMKIKLWRPDPIVGATRPAPTFELGLKVLNDPELLVTVTPVATTALEIQEAMLDIFTIYLPSDYQNKVGIMTVRALVTGTTGSNKVMFVLRAPQ